MSKTRKVKQSVKRSATYKPTYSFVSTVTAPLYVGSVDRKWTRFKLIEKGVGIFKCRQTGIYSTEVFTPASHIRLGY